jgi:NAD(P)H-nitrite reductase large subunit
VATYLIVGNGVAGTRAAEAIRQRDDKGAIIILGDEPYPFYYRPQLADFAFGRATERSIAAKHDAFYREQRIDVRPGRRVAGVNAKKHQVTLDDGEAVRYDRLLVATGSTPKRGEWPGSDLEGVIALWNLDDAKKIASWKGLKRAVVVGENSIGLETARAFRELGAEVTYLVRGDRFWPEMLDADAASIIQQNLAARGLTLRKSEQLASISGSGRVERVTTSNNEVIECQAVGFALGLNPTVGFLEGSGIEVNAGVVADERMQSGARDVFSAGDAAERTDPLSGRKRVQFGWLKAWHEGNVAGANMAGDRQAIGDIPALHIQIYGTDFLALGENNPAPQAGVHKDTGFFPDMGVYKSVVRRNGTVVGATFLGNVAEAGVIEKMIAQKADISTLDAETRDQMFNENYVRSRAVGVLCPVCKMAVALPAGAKQGDVLTCPICGVNLRLERMANGLLGGRVA